MRMKKALCSVAIVIVLAACTPPPRTVTRPEEAMMPISLRKAVPADDMALKDLTAAVHQSLEYYKKLPADTLFLFGPDRVTARDMAVTLQSFLLIIENKSISTEKKLDLIGKDFVFYRAAGSDGSGKVLFTG